MSPELTNLEIAFLIVAISSCVVGFLAAVRPSRVWTLIRTGLTYAMLFIRKRQSDELEEQRAREDEKRAALEKDKSARIEK